MADFNEGRISQEDLIILPGGGNFGDLWKPEHNFKERIVENFPKNKIIIFPQSVFFEEKENLERSIAIFSKHPNLTLFARDSASFKFLKENFRKNKVLLAPDTGVYNSVKISKNRGGVKKVIFLRRNDKELKEEIDTSYLKNVETHEWPSLEKTLLKKFRRHKFVKVLLDYTQLFLLKYDLVITNRLHGFIIALKLGIPVILLDNSYSKNLHFFKTWIKNKPGHFYADNQKELRKIIEENFPEILK